MSRSNTGPGPGPRFAGPGPEVQVRGPQKGAGPDLDWTLDSLLPGPGQRADSCWHFLSDS